MPTPPAKSTVDETALVIRVLRGKPGDAEAAALVAALLVLAETGAAWTPPARSPWGDPAWRPDAPLRAAPGAWRLSGLPR